MNTQEHGEGDIYTEDIYTDCSEDLFQDARSPSPEQLHGPPSAFLKVSGCNWASERIDADVFANGRWNAEISDICQYADAGLDVISD